MPQTFPREAVNRHGFSSQATPHQWRNDPSVKDRYYYTFPPDLFENILAAIGTNRLSREDVERERDLAKIVGDHSLNVGHWNGSTIPYSYLLPRPPLVFDKATRDFLGLSLAEAAANKRALELQLDSFDTPLRGYLGWLLTQKLFLDEHDALIDQHRAQIQRHGFPQPLNSRPDPSQYQAEEGNEFTRNFEDFYARWRLLALAAPYLPVPQAPLLPDRWTSRAKNLPEGCQSVFLPDISPITGQGVINVGLNDSLRGSKHPEHLSGWMNIIRKENASKQQIRTFERRFRLQHFWIVLYHRYPEATHRRKRPLMDVFADYLGVELTTVKRDLDQLARNVGPKWATRACDLC